MQLGSPTHIDPFQIAGISVRTSNLNGQSARDIGQLWSEFFTLDIAAQIRGKISNELICAYLDYELEMNGPYTTVLGYRVEPGQQQLPPVQVFPVKASAALVFHSENADPQTVLGTWMGIWNTEIERAYQSDYDLYTADGKVRTYVSVRNH